MNRFYYHSKENASGVRVTIAGDYYEESKVLHVAAARCSERDQFSRKEGREIASGRLMTGETIAKVSTTADEFTGREFVDVANSFAPELIRNSAFVHGKKPA